MSSGKCRPICLGLNVLRRSQHVAYLLRIISTRIGDDGTETLKPLHKLRNKYVIWCSEYILSVLRIISMMLVDPDQKTETIKTGQYYVKIRNYDVLKT